MIFFWWLRDLRDLFLVITNLAGVAFFRLIQFYHFDRLDVSWQPMPANTTRKKRHAHSIVCPSWQKCIVLFSRNYILPVEKQFHASK